jgi:hypothetical protein
MSGHASALLQAARLWERTSAKGTRYMSGRLGGVINSGDKLRGKPAS